MQKLLQIIARQPGLEPEFADILRKLESDVRAVPLEEFRKALQGEQVRRLYPSRLTIQAERPLGSGTIAQTFRGKLTLDSGEQVDVAVRAIRPGTLERVNEEDALLKSRVPAIEANPAYRDTIFANFGQVQRDLDLALRKELDVVATGRNQMTARRAYVDWPTLPHYGRGKVSDILVPEVYYPETASDGLLIQRLIEGVPPEEFFRKYPHLQAPVMEDLAVAWSREALFGSGFFHADLHEGNLLFRMGPNGRVVTGMLDLGMSGTLSPSQRRGLIRLAAGLEAGDGAGVRQTLLNDLGLKPGKLESVQFDHVIQTHLQGQKSMELLLDELISHGAIVDDTMISFSRGNILLNQRLANSGSKLSMTQLRRSLAETLLKFEGANRMRLFKRSPPLTDFSNKELMEFGRMDTGQCLRSLLRHALP
jgi:predicted unusual protein kinase regulating ubiquinone biosynthesis (AarF/ABC1/UbiB family)